MALATIAQVQAILGRQVEENVLEQATELLEMASGVARAEMGGQLIEKVTGDVLSIRADPDGIIRLPQRPVTAVTSVAIGTMVLASTTYWFDQWAGTLHSLWDRPWQILSINSPWHPQSFTVVYDHGFDVVPADISTVVAQMAADVMRRSWRGTKDQAVPVAGLGLSLNRAQKGVLANYKRRFTMTHVAAGQHHG